MKVGSIVMFINSKLLLHYPDYYPPIKTIGTVLAVYKSDNTVYVQWPSGSTSSDDRWWCDFDDVIEISSNA